MPVGENIAVLIPLSIILTVTLLFVFSLFIQFSERMDIVKMSQTSLNVGEYVINDEFHYKNGIALPENHWGCGKISELNITSNYKVKINITNLETGRWWCWGNVDGADKVVVNSLPTLIIKGENVSLAKVSIIVGK